MAVLVGMPKLGMNMTKGTIIRWLLLEGDIVDRGQPLLEVETDKVVQEVESPASGILAKIVKGEDVEVPCTNVIAVITAPGESLPDRIPETLVDAVPPKSDVEVVVPQDNEKPGYKRGVDREQKQVPVSPVARKLAQELGVDLDTIVPDGKRINKEDVEAAYRVKQEAMTIANASLVHEVVSNKQAQRLPLRGMRRTIAEHVGLSARTVARVGLTLEMDVTALIAWRDQLSHRGYTVGYSVLLAKVVARALQEFRYMNSQMVDDEIREMMNINVGIATDTERGLLVPVIRNASDKGVLEINREFTEMVERARNGKSTVDDLSEGTFTITNLGMYEIEEFLPIVNLPECAIMGIGTILKKPVAVNDKVEIRPRMIVTLAFDHRLVDGAPAARFLQRIKHLIEEPLELLD